MEFLASIFSLAKNVTETDREFKILKEKLDFHIRKAEKALKMLEKQHHIDDMYINNLSARLRDAHECLAVIENLLSAASSEDKQGISLYFVVYSERIRLNYHCLLTLRGIKQPRPQRIYAKQLKSLIMTIILRENIFQPNEKFSFLSSRIKQMLRQMRCMRWAQLFKRATLLILQWNILRTTLSN